MRMLFVPGVTALGFFRDPQFAEKAGRILDLYNRAWNGQPLEDDEFVLSADEKTSIQARRRRHATYPAQSGQPMKVEHEYARCGAWAYLAALDVHHGKLFGRCERRSGILSFDQLVEDVMSQPPYKTARRVFWIVDNGSSHRGPRSVERLQSRYANLVLVHVPVHASWLNQIEIYFSILQRKALMPNDFQSLEILKERILGGNDNRKLTICDHRILTTPARCLCIAFEMTRVNHLTPVLSGKA